MTEDASNEYERTMTEEMSVAPAPMAIEIGKNVSAAMPKNMVTDPGWFDSN